MVFRCGKQSTCAEDSKKDEADWRTHDNEANPKWGESQTIDE
jgi:hypothetical protein